MADDCVSEKVVGGAPKDVPAPTVVPADTLKLNPNCCYEACIGCSSIKKLSELRARYPHDWKERLRGSERLLALAKSKE